MSDILIFGPILAWLGHGLWRDWRAGRLSRAAVEDFGGKPAIIGALALIAFLLAFGLPGLLLLFILWSLCQLLATR